MCRAGVLVCVAQRRLGWNRARSHTLGQKKDSEAVNKDEENVHKICFSDSFTICCVLVRIETGTGTFKVLWLDV
jgi:hypothetical protein